MPIAAPFYVRRVLRDEHGQVAKDSDGDVMSDDSDTGIAQDWALIPMPDMNNVDGDPVPTFCLMVNWENESSPAMVPERFDDLENCGLVGSSYLDLEEDGEGQEAGGESEEDEHENNPV